MSDLGSPPPSSPQDAKAQAKASKAYAKASRPWFKKKRFIIPIAFVAIIFIATSLSGGETGTPTASGNTSDASDSQPSDDKDSSDDASGGLNEPVRDGKFEFTVKKVDCSKKRIGPADFGEKAQGQFCLVSMTIENIAKEPQTLFGDNQLLFDKEGREFSADTEAAIFLENAQTLFEEINPGNKVNGVVVFDIPKDAKPATLELHDSAFSGGVTVSVN